MRILIYCDDPGCGGTAVNAALLTEGLAKAGFHTTLIGGMPGPLSIPLGYNTLRNPLKTIASRNEPETLFLTHRPELVFFCDAAPNSSLAAKRVCQDWGIPYIILINYVDRQQVSDNSVPIESLHAVHKNALTVVAVSNNNLTLLRKYFGVPVDRSSVIYNGKQRSFFEPAPKEARASRRRDLKLSDTDILCLTVGRYEPRKGYLALLNAASLLAGHAAGPRLSFAWIGHDNGDFRATLAAMIEERGLASRVALLGQRNDVREWLGAADIFVLPSESEGMPLSIIEAMGQGVPVVATAVSGIPELLANTGKLLPDPQREPDAVVPALVQALLALAIDPAGRRKLGEAGKRRALAYFTAETMLGHYVRLLNSLVPLLRPPRWPVPDSYEPPNLAPFGKDIFLDDDAAVLEYLRDGWSHGEAGGRWTDGGKARLVLALPPAFRGGVVIDFDVKPFLGDAEAVLRVRILCLGRELGMYRWSQQEGPSRLDIAIFPDGHALSQLELLFAIEGAASPRTYGLSTDDRKLGIWISRLRVSRMLPPDRTCEDRLA